MIQIHVLKLGSHLQAGSFEEFARTRYLPSLQAPDGYEGELLGARLLRRQRTLDSEPLDIGTEFLLVCDWSGGAANGLPKVGDVTVQRLFEVYDARVTSLGSFETVAGGTVKG